MGQTPRYQALSGAWYIRSCLAHWSGPWMGGVSTKQAVLERHLCAVCYFAESLCLLPRVILLGMKNVTCHYQ